jgi:hypothetical protein
VDRVAEEILSFLALDDLALVHHRDSVADRRDR